MNFQNVYWHGIAHSAMVGNKFQAMDCLMFQNQKPLSDSVTRILKCICFKNWTIADHNPRSSWREGTQAEDLMRAAYDMQVGDVGNVGVLPSGKEILVLGECWWLVSLKLIIFVLRQKNPTLSTQWRFRGLPTLLSLRCTGSVVCPKICQSLPKSPNLYHHSAQNNLQCIQCVPGRCNKKLDPEFKEIQMTIPEK